VAVAPPCRRYIARAPCRKPPDDSLHSATLRDLLRPRHDLIIENLALRQQILVLERAGARPRLRPADKAFWVVLSRCWRHWRRPLRLVKPSTVIAWHRRGWRLYWRGRSRPGKGGRPGIPIAAIDLIRRMSHFPLWGAPRIHGELLMLGIMSRSS